LVVIAIVIIDSLEVELSCTYVAVVSCY